ncbi:hypothetical protein [Desulfobacter latus]|uniref:Uncharacterized protein n=1 Tax=Desulfobacter latus TaxID=2292 RepID=A0A850SYR2_9BACT|nr:hypothetical protein [Desulfobacter latus]NWH06444.1 hypothetical protein [Desulfobacter latus]
MSIKKDEYGFIRSSGYGRVDLDTLRSQLNADPDEAIYHTSNSGGVRSSRQVKDGSVPVQPGDTFNAGPQVVKASLLTDLFNRQHRERHAPQPRYQRIQGQSEPAPDNAVAAIPLFDKEVRAIKKAGFGAVPSPKETRWGWCVRLKGLTLPGGSRTDAMILLPKNYPNASPIGFYLKAGANTGGLDRGHLYDTTYHGAVDLSAHGWQWFCGIAEGWKPGRHNLVTYLSMVLTMLSERRG